VTCYDAMRAAQQQGMDTLPITYKNSRMYPARERDERLCYLESIFNRANCVPPPQCQHQSQDEFQQSSALSDFELNWEGNMQKLVAVLQILAETDSSPEAAHSSRRSKFEALLSGWPRVPFGSGVFESTADSSRQLLSVVFDRETELTLERVSSLKQIPSHTAVPTLAAGDESLEGTIRIIVSHDGSARALEVGDRIRGALCERGAEVELLCDALDCSWFFKCKQKDVCIVLLSALYLHEAQLEGQLTFARDNNKRIVSCILDPECRDMSVAWSGSIGSPFATANVSSALQLKGRDTSRIDDQGEIGRLRALLAESQREKDREMAEKDREMAEKDREMAEKMAEKDREMAEKMAEKDREMAEKMAEDPDMAENMSLALHHTAPSKSSCCLLS